MLTQDRISELVREAYEEYKRILPIKQCWLYGSYARGDMDEESDIDILMTTDENDEKIHACRKRLSAVSSALSIKYDVTVSIAIKTAALFEKRTAFVPYYRNVVMEGKAYA